MTVNGIRSIGVTTDLNRRLREHNRNPQTIDHLLN